MTSEYDFLDKRFSEVIIKHNVIRWKNENFKLRRLNKLYRKALDEYRVRLKQLLTEKMAVIEDERKLAELDKKLEEAKLYVQATYQLNKQLQELSKSHDKDKNEWKEKAASYEEKVRELKKSVSDMKQKKKKSTKILLELSEILLKSGLFPKKYKRSHRLWKSEVQKKKDGTDDILIDLEENLKEDPMEIQEAIVSSLICLSRHFHHRVSHALDLWVPTSNPSEELTKTMIAFIKRTPFDFWSKSFRSWHRRHEMPKHINVQSRPGTYFTPAKPEEYWGGKKEWCATGATESGAWKGRGKGPRRARWIKMHSQLDWIKKEEESWDIIAWVKTPKRNIPQNSASEKPLLVEKKLTHT